MLILNFEVARGFFVDSEPSRAESRSYGKCDRLEMKVLIEAYCIWKDFEISSCFFGIFSSSSFSSQGFHCSFESPRGFAGLLYLGFFYLFRQ